MHFTQPGRGEGGGRIRKTSSKRPTHHPLLSPNTFLIFQGTIIIDWKFDNNIYFIPHLVPAKPCKIFLFMQCIQATFKEGMIQRNNLQNLAPILLVMNPHPTNLKPHVFPAPTEQSSLPSMWTKARVCENCHHLCIRNVQATCVAPHLTIQPTKWPKGSVKIWNPPSLSSKLTIRKHVFLLHKLHTYLILSRKYCSTFCVPLSLLTNFASWTLTHWRVWSNTRLMNHYLLTQDASDRK